MRRRRKSEKADGEFCSVPGNACPALIEILPKYETGRKTFICCFHARGNSEKVGTHALMPRLHLEQANKDCHVVNVESEFRKWREGTIGRV